MVSRSFLFLAIGACLVACGGSEFGSASDGNSLGAAGNGEQSGSAGSVNASDAASTGSSGAGGTMPSHDGSAGSVGTGGAGGKGGAGGMSGSGLGGSVCPPCAAPPNPSCVGQGICGCGPYICPDAGKDAAVEAGPRCGETVCEAGKVCCNALRGICTAPGMVCIQ